MQEILAARTDFDTARSDCDTEAPQNEPCAAAFDLAEEVATVWASVNDEGVKAFALFEPLEAASERGDASEVASIIEQGFELSDTGADLGDQFDGLFDEYLEAAGPCS